MKKHTKITKYLILLSTLFIPVSTFAVELDIDSANYSFYAGRAGSERSMASVGDLNQDSYTDFAVGAWNADKVYVYYGSDSFNPSSTSLEDADAVFESEGNGHRFGWSVSDAGDVDGDGYDDFLIGAQREDSGSDGGAAYLVYGSSTEYSGTIAIADVAAKFNAESANDSVGHDLAGVGDIDGDTYDDFIISAYAEDTGGSSAGAVYLLYGSSTRYSGTISLADADAKFTGEATGDIAGWSTSSAGDVDGDGYRDFMVGARDNDNGFVTAGAVYLLYGSSTRYSGTISLADADAIFTGPTVISRAGYAISSEYIDGDNYSDLLVGADSGVSGIGAVYLVYGSSTRYSGTISLADADASFIGEADDNKLGRSVMAGDINGDDIVDLLFGAPENDDTATNAGSAYLILGTGVRFSGEENVSDAADVIFRGLGDTYQAGSEIAVLNDVNGDGYNEFLIGSTTDASVNGNTGVIYMYAPSSQDLTFTGNTAASVECKAVYTDAGGVSATDNFTGSSASLTANASAVDTDTVGSYSVTFTGESIFGIDSVASRTVTVSDTTDPIVTLTGESSVTLTVGDTYPESGATATDACDSSVTAAASGTVDTETAGTYTVTYTATDDSDNSATATRTVTVEEDTSGGGDDPEDVTVTGVTPLTNSRVRITYSDDSTRTINAFSSGSQKPRVKLTSDGARVVVLKRNGRNVRVFDALTGERLRGKKLRTKSQDRAYMKLVEKSGKEYVVVATKRGNTIRTTLMRLTASSDKLLNTNTKRLTYRKSNFRVQIRNSRIRIKKLNGTVKRVYKITSNHNLKKVR